ncbi:MAG: hypothetical protein QM741_12955 [Rudaea sp.]|uniref:hypothetical protein n=1 Tax=Rudaea sp. TaxID=2136325 RepID=UPI0039E57FC8
MDTRTKADDAIASPTTAVRRPGDARPPAPTQPDAHSADAPRTPAAVSALEALALCMQTGSCGA